MELYFYIFWTFLAVASVAVLLTILFLVAKPWCDHLIDRYYDWSYGIIKPKRGRK